jgi:hypothetical protein
MSERDRTWDVMRIVVTVLFIAVAAAALIRALSFRPLAAYFPVAAAGMVILCGSAQLVLDVRNYLADRPVVIFGLDVASMIHGMGMQGLLPALRFMAWFLSYIALFYVTGMIVSSLVFVATFLRTEARWSWRGTVVLSVLLVSGISAMVYLLELDLPRTMLDLGHDLLV